MQGELHALAEQVCHHYRKRFIGAMLEWVWEQAFVDPYHVFDLDDGLQDRTGGMVRGFPIRCATMPPEQLTYGRALNHGAS